ncbi:MAG: translation initiation factor IF-2 [bacterium]
MKVSELARELHISVKCLLDELKRAGIYVLGPASELKDSQVKEFVRKRKNISRQGVKIEGKRREDKDRVIIKKERSDSDSLVKEKRTKRRLIEKMIEEETIRDKKSLDVSKRATIKKMVMKRKMKLQSKPTGVSKTQLKKIRAKEKKEHKEVVIRNGLLVIEIARLFKVEIERIIEILEELNVGKASYYNYIEPEIVIKVGSKLGFDVVLDEGIGVPRPPIVAMLGHVDHGKTTLLDAIRKTDIASREYGGITQYIGASLVEIDGNQIIFIDTPGHEAFTQMRARGAQVTDIVVLVVAADDGVMPQTIEAYNHSKASGVEIIVAINKIDKAGINIDQIKKNLSELGLVCEEWGGDTLFSEVSALKGIGIDDLIEKIMLQAELLELRGYPQKRARGVVIESKIDKGKGPLATVIMMDGTLRIGDGILVGNQYGKVRAMMDPKGRFLREATPGMPVEIIGISGVCDSGDYLYEMEETLAKEMSGMLLSDKKREVISTPRLTLDEWFKLMQEGGPKELPLIIKCDTYGTAEAIKRSIEQIVVDEYKTSILHCGVGSISESDVLLASASNAVIMGFNVNIEQNAKKEIEKEKVDVRLYRIIYDIIDDVRKALTGMLSSISKEEILGRAEVRHVFNISKLGNIAGCSVISGKIVKNSRVRVLRNNEIIFDGVISSLKRFKENVKEVLSGFECGIGTENFNEFEIGDILESYKLVEVKRGV